MKKLIALTLILCLMPLAALACEGTPLSASQTPPLSGEAMPAARIENGAEALTGCAWFCIDESRHLIGKWNAEAREEIFSAVDSGVSDVRGLLANGAVRAKGELKYIEACGLTLGLTKLGCTVEIREEYAALVREIVESRVDYPSAADGCASPDRGGLTAARVIAATQWRTAATIYHVFFLPDAAKAPVGTVWLNGGKSAVTLYAGTFEGTLVLGFVTGGMKAEEQPDEPATPAPIIQNVYITQKIEQKTCVKIVQDNRQINVNSAVENKQKQTVILGGSKGRDNWPHCRED